VIGNTLNLLFLGKNKYRLREIILRKVLNDKNKNEIKVKYLGEKVINYTIKPHDFKNMVLKSEIKDRIINGLTYWNEKKEWYKSHQLVHKIGVLLYGKPGTGKSTIARCISNMFDNATILVINPNDIMISVAKILEERKKSIGKLIILIEDFDMYFYDRSKQETEETKKKANNQNVLFQILDGVYSTEDTIYIATTNYKDKINAGMIRYGSFDIQEEIGYFDKDMCDQFCIMMNTKLDTEYPSELVEPAWLQGKIMELNSKKQ